MVLSKTLNNELICSCEICQKSIDDIQVAITCSLCNYMSHKKCNKSHFKNFVAISKKSKFPICNDCKKNTLPFQNQYIEKNKDSDNDNSNFKKFFDTIGIENLEHITDENNINSTPLNCKYVDYDSFNYSQDEKNLSIFHMNIASLAAHKEELETALKILDYKFEIIGLTETKIIKNSTPMINISLQGYKCFHTPTEASKGGTILYIDDKLNSKPRNDLENMIYSSKELESSFIEIINPGKKNIVVGCI